jgi:hypothetical protein
MYKVVLINPQTYVGLFCKSKGGFPINLTAGELAIHKAIRPYLWSKTESFIPRPF